MERLYGEGCAKAWEEEIYLCDWVADERLQGMLWCSKGTKGKDAFGFGTDQVRQGILDEHAGETEGEIS